MSLAVFGITIQLELDGYAVDCFGITIQLELDGYAVDCLRHNHLTWMVMPLTVFGITIQLGWLCR
jgi:hypothetical protein